jgi:hypothetical protein
MRTAIPPGPRHTRAFAAAADNLSSPSGCADPRREPPPRSVLLLAAGFLRHYD